MKWWSVWFRNRRITSKTWSYQLHRATFLYLRIGYSHLLKLSSNIGNNIYCTFCVDKRNDVEWLHTDLNTSKISRKIFVKDLGFTSFFVLRQFNDPGTLLWVTGYFSNKKSKSCLRVERNWSVHHTFCGNCFQQYLKTWR